MKVLGQKRKHITEEVAPASLVDLLNFPQHVLDAIASHDDGTALPNGAMKRLVQQCQQHWACYSAYSGMACWEIAFQHLKRAMLGSEMREQLTFVEAWECKQAAVHLLQGMGEAGPRHIFSNINDKLNMKAKAVIDRLEEAMLAAASLDEKQRALAVMQQTFSMLEASGELFSTPSSKRHCSQCQKRCSTWESMGQLQVAFAGMTCKDISIMNRAKPGPVGPSARTLLTWLYEMRY